MKPVFLWIMSGLIIVMIESQELKPTMAFEVDERLVYDVSWLGISAGTAQLRVMGKKNIGDKLAYRIKVSAETSKLFSNFFKVQDEITSVFTVDDFHSLQYRKTLKEGHYRNDVEIVYNQEDGFGVYKGKQFAITNGVRDPICSLYYLRSLNLSSVKELMLKATADNKTYDILVKIHGEEDLKLGEKKYRAIKIEPLPIFENRIFQKNQSELTIWLSTDGRHVPLRIEAKVKIGAIRADFVEGS